MSSIKIQEKAVGSELTIDVEKGFNAISCKLVKNDIPYEILYFRGAPILFPFANRLLLNENGEFLWQDSQGKIWEVQVLNKALVESNLVKDNQYEKSVRHGFARYLPFEIIDQRENSITGRLSFSDHDLLPRFYKGLTIEITHSLEEGAWNTVAKVTNTSMHEMPIAYCVHYWFNIKLSNECVRDNCEITIPAQRHWLSKNSLPTGQLENVGNTRFDFRVGKKIGEDNFYDDVLLRDSAEQDYEAKIYVLEEDTNIILSAQGDFRNVVLYVPKDQPETVCIEPQTSSVDMFRMHVKGLKKEANILVLAEGETKRFKTQVTLE